MGCSGETGMNKDNYIIAEIEIRDFEEESTIQIISSYDYLIRNVPDERREEENDDDLLNEKEIKDCVISIDGKIIPFDYHYKFGKQGKYTIKYTFNHLLTKTDYMFCYCNNLRKIDLTHLNTEKVTNMSFMFHRLIDVEVIDVSKLNTKNVKDMMNMFFYCEKVTELDVSKFDTKNVINMSFNRIKFVKVEYKGSN